MNNIKTWDSKRITTFIKFDAMYNLPKGTAKQGFADNRKNYVQGVDFAPVQIGEYMKRFPNERRMGNPSYTMIILYDGGVQKLADYFGKTSAEADDEITGEEANALTVFTYEGRNVRTIMIDGEPWWVLKDVCDVLHLTNARVVAENQLDEDEVSKTYVGVATGTKADGSPALQQKEVHIISESGLYSLIMRSNKPEAKAFKRWVTHEVLPAIRKTGSYKREEVKIDIEDVEIMTKRDWLTVLTALAKVSNEALPMFKKILDKIAPDENFFDNVTKTTVRVAVPENFAEQLKKALTESGMTQSQLADKADLPKSGVSQYLSGKTVPNEKSYEKIKNALTFNFN
jgi:prophage antirepressor-like protein